MSQEHPKPGEWYARALPPRSGSQEWAVYVNHEGGSRSIIAKAYALPDSTDQAEFELASQRSEEVAVGISALHELIEACRDGLEVINANPGYDDREWLHRLQETVIKMRLAIRKAGAGTD